jgi:hypothetical protein
MVRVGPAGVKETWVVLVDRSQLTSWPATVDEDGRDVEVAGAHRFREIPCSTLPVLTMTRPALKQRCDVRSKRRSPGSRGGGDPAQIDGSGLAALDKCVGWP